MIMYVPVISRANTVTVRPVELVCFSLLSYTLNDNVCTSDIKGKYCYCEASRVGLFLIARQLSE